MEIENLIKQRQALDAQISDIKTQEVRKTISELEENYEDLTQKIADAKAYKKTSDEEIARQIAEHRKKIEELKNVSLSNIYKVSQLESDRVANGQKLREQKEILNSLLSMN